MGALVIERREVQAREHNGASAIIIAILSNLTVGAPADVAGRAINRIGEVDPVLQVTGGDDEGAACAGRPFVVAKGIAVDLEDNRVFRAGAEGIDRVVGDASPVVFCEGEVDGQCVIDFQAGCTGGIGELAELEGTSAAFPETGIQLRAGEAVKEGLGFDKCQVSRLAAGRTRNVADHGSVGTLVFYRRTGEGKGGRCGAFDQFRVAIPGIGELLAIGGDSEGDALANSGKLISRLTADHRRVDGRVFRAVNLRAHESGRSRISGRSGIETETEVDIFFHGEIERCAQNLVDVYLNGLAIDKQLDDMLAAVGKELVQDGHLDAAAACFECIMVIDPALIAGVIQRFGDLYPLGAIAIANENGTAGTGGAGVVAHRVAIHHVGERVHSAGAVALLCPESGAAPIIDREGVIEHDAPARSDEEFAIGIGVAGFPASVVLAPIGRTDLRLHEEVFKEQFARVGCQHLDGVSGHGDAQVVLNRDEGAARIDLVHRDQLFIG